MWRYTRCNIVIYSAKRKAGYFFAAHSVYKIQLETMLGVAAVDIQTFSAVFDRGRTVSWKYIIILVKIRAVIFPINPLSIIGNV
jgi:hypothetical protein